MRAARGLPALLLALLTLGCGSTVQQQTTTAGSVDAAALGGDGLAVPGAEPGRPQQQQSGQASDLPVGGLAPGSTSGSSGGGGGAPSVAQPASGSTAGTAPGRPQAATGRGPVTVGLLYLDGADEFASRLGISGLSTGDAEAQARAIVAHLNARGGLNGRPIKLVTYGMRAGSDPTAEHGAACAALVEDEKVSYVVSYVQLQGTYLACYAKHGVGVLDDASLLLDEQGASYRNIFAAPGDLLAGRAVRNLVDSLWRTGWLTKDSVVGTLVYDTPDGRALEQRHLLPALKRYGIVPKVTARSSESADGVSQQNGFVLQYRSARVDRIIPAGASPLFLMTGAESQNYRPKYAVQSTFGPGFLEGAAPRDQLRGAAGIGWQPSLDIGAGKKPGPVSSNETRCLDVMKKSGQEGTGTTRAFQLHLCNSFFWLQAAAKAVGVGPDLLPRARAALGRTFQPSNTFSSVADPKRVDGAGSFRELSYVDSCECFQYTSADRPIG